MRSFFLLLLSGLVLILVQTTPWGPAFFRSSTQDLSFVFVIFIALNPPSPIGWLLAFLLGYVLDALSGGPAGLLILIGLAIFFLVRCARRIMLLESVPSRAVVVFALCASVNLALSTIAGAMEAGPLGPIIKNIFSHSLWAAAYGVPFFALYKKACVHLQNGGRERAVL